MRIYEICKSACYSEYLKYPKMIDDHILLAQFVIVYIALRFKKNNVGVAVFCCVFSP
jgi:hypothetical protein